jgi:hypothetical protein
VHENGRTARPPPVESGDDEGIAVTVATGGKLIVTAISWTLCFCMDNR